MRDLNKHISEKIELFVLGELDEKEHKLVFDSILGSKAYRDYYNQLQAIVKGENYSRISNEFNNEQSWERLNKRISLSDTVDKINYKLLFRIAATLVILISFFLAYFLLQTHSKQPKRNVANNIVEAPLGSITRLTLPDKTHVTLNAGSIIKYPDNYNYLGKREVTLHGEAFFKVAENKVSPFIVKAKDINIKALGTSFNVKAYEDEKIVEATLVEGIIQIQKEGDDKNTITLGPNQKASIFPDLDKTSIEETFQKAQEQTSQLIKVSKIDKKKVLLQKNIDPVLTTSWKDVEWVIQKQSLGELAKVLERKFNIKFRFESNSLKEYIFSGRFTNEPLELVLEALKLTAPIKFKIEKGMVIIQEDESKIKEYQRYLKNN